MGKIVWEFTNGKKLDKEKFLDYFERKFFRTIRKFSMLPASRKVVLKRSSDINNLVIRAVLEKKFSVGFSDEPDFSNENLSQVAEEIFRNVLNGKFVGSKPEDKPFRPLYFLSDAEIELYAKLKSLQGKRRTPDERIRKLFEKFMTKNPDLEHNVVNASRQL